MKKFLSAALAMVLLIGLMPALGAAEAPTSGPPVFNVTTTVVPDTLSVYQNEAVTFTATTTYTSNKNENQLLHFVSDSWLGAEVLTPAAQTIAPTVEGEPAAAPNERSEVFVSQATVFVSDQTGDYDVLVKYTITLQHDQSGQRTYQTVSSSALVTITVMPGTVEEPPAEEAIPEGQALNHGQIVSAWAHWKQTKGNKNFAAGGPGVYRSLVWYKTQVEDKTFYTKQEVWDYLESIYEPMPSNRKNNNGKGNNGNNGNGNNGNNGNPGNNGKGK